MDKKIEGLYVLIVLQIMLVLSYYLFDLYITDHRKYIFGSFLLFFTLIFCLVFKKIYEEDIKTQQEVRNRWRLTLMRILAWIVVVFDVLLCLFNASLMTRMMSSLERFAGIAIYADPLIGLVLLTLSLQLRRGWQRNNTLRTQNTQPDI